MRYGFDGRKKIARDNNIRQLAIFYTMRIFIQFFYLITSNV